MTEIRNIALAFLFVLGMMVAALDTDPALMQTHTAWSK